MDHNTRSILVVTRSQELADRITAGFRESRDTRVKVAHSSLAAMNGHAAELTFESNVVIFEADPEDEREMAAIRELLTKGQEDTLFLALTDGDVSLSKARWFLDAGIDEVLPSGISFEGLSGVIDKSLNARRTPAAHHMAPDQNEGFILSVAQARGGAGGTTVAVNLACALLGHNSLFKRATKARVALLDLDLQFGNANVLLDLEDNGAFSTLITSGQLPDRAYVRSMMQSHSSGLDILNAPPSIVPLTALRPDLVAALLDALRAEYDYVVVDLPRVLTEWLEPVLLRTDRMTIVMDTSVPSVRHAKRLMDFYREVQIGLSVGLVVNRESRPMIRTAAQKEAEDVLGASFSHWLPDRPRIVRKATDQGQPFMLGHAGSDIGKAFRKFADATQNSLPRQIAIAN
ncbi:AAA family ATPase [Pseudogemmobacter sp. W21_MBD1_M6]|uniref:AAA family ATPase n=1 Tax=Pseudogemmobacter sp. W21_MBD1_M6 TaxID=3240271 RepID=UPI003F9ADC12